MQLNESSAQQRLIALGLDDMPVMEYTPIACKLDSDWFKKYSSIRDEFVNLVMGKELPDNLSIRFRIPLLWGGKLEIDNMFLCWTFPHSFNMDRFIIEQSDAKTIFLPNPEKKVYLTTHTGGGGDGGNASSDRLSQAAFNLMSDRGNE